MSREGAARQARQIMRERFVIFDTETTGLNDYGDKIVQFAAITSDGVKLLDTLINPGRSIPADATAIHGITGDMVADAPTFEEAYPLIFEALHNQRWVVYNLEFDKSFLEAECELAYLIQPAPSTRFRHTQAYCAMMLYAQWWGDVHHYYGDYTWQKLSTARERHDLQVRGAAHDALTDCYATLELMKMMARS